MALNGDLAWDQDLFLKRISSERLPDQQTTIDPDVKNSLFEIDIQMKDNLSMPLQHPESV